ncbi:uncharacterized protein V1518DRAFT_418881 [Limtongia smithiae]|uniref:uncharacterized protein n=1 Tax=Limtongia smithiae TaxID=1125753 RepID=UPI0034CF8E86
MTSQRKSVVVVGGGVFGLAFITQMIRALAEKPLTISDGSGAIVNLAVDITLIEQRDAAVFLPIVLRMCVEDHNEDYIKPYDRLFANYPSTAGVGAVVKASVVSIDEASNVVVLDTGARVAYDVLILATGATWQDPSSPPTDKSDIYTYYDHLRARIIASTNVAVLGAGSVGLELAGEIKSKFGASKNVTLVHRDALPLSSRFPHKFRTKCSAIMQELGVDGRYNTSGRDNGDGTVTLTQNGKDTIVHADVVFNCFASRPSAPYAPDAWKDDAGALKVLDTFQVDTSSPSVFSLGDVNNVNELKLASNARPAVSTVALPNVLAVLKGETPSRYYIPPAQDGMGMVLGKRHATGIAWLPLWGAVVLPSMFVLRKKGEDMHALTIARMLGY